MFISKSMRIFALITLLTPMITQPMECFSNLTAPTTESRFVKPSLLGALTGACLYGLGCLAGKTDAKASHALATTSLFALAGAVYGYFFNGSNAKKKEVRLSSKPAEAIIIPAEEATSKTNDLNHDAILKRAKMTAGKKKATKKPQFNAQKKDKKQQGAPTIVPASENSSSKLAAPQRQAPVVVTVTPAVATPPAASSPIIAKIQRTGGVAVMGNNAGKPVLKKTVVVKERKAPQAPAAQPNELQLKLQKQREKQQQETAKK